MKALLKNKQLLYLFLCNFAIVFIGFGLFPLLPLYAAEFGAGPSFIGIYLAMTYVAISVGSIFAGQLSELLQRKPLFVLAGWLGTVSLFLLGQAQSLWQVVLLTALVWFAGGIGLSVSNVLTGLYTTPSTRGRIFGLLALSSPLGALIGGLVVGRAIEWGGYPFMFLVMTVVWTVYPVLGMVKVQDHKEDCSAPVTAVHSAAPQPRLGSVFVFLLVAVFLASMTVSIGRMGFSMSMKDMQFSPNELSVASAIGGLVTIPITLFTGVLSDRLGRKRFLMLGYLMAVGSTLMLIGARSLWQFWMVSALVLASRNVISAMSSAYATDILRRRFLGKALPVVGSMNWVSGVIGFAGSGYVLDAFGPVILYGTASVVAVVGGIILAFLPSKYVKSLPASVLGAKETVPTTGD